MFLKLQNRIRRFWNDKDGSEATEMLLTTAMLVTLIMTGIMILSYIIALNNVNFATKRAVREAEVTGIVSESALFERFNEALGDSDTLINRRLALSDVRYVRGNCVQLKDTFRVTTSCDYIIQLINPGNFEGYRLELPVTVSVTGMSEVYYSTR